MSEPVSEADEAAAERFEKALDCKHPYWHPGPDSTMICASCGLNQAAVLGKLYLSPPVFVGTVGTLPRR